MTAHELALSLGAAAFDFVLTPSERDALDRHLGSCLQCRSELDGMADDARRLVSRPVHRMSPARTAAVRASLERPRRAMSPAMVLVAAALLLLLGIAVAAVGAEIVRRLDESRLAIDPAPSTMPSSIPSQAPTQVAWTSWPVPPVDDGGRWELVVAGSTREFATASGVRAIAAGLRTCPVVDPVTRELTGCVQHVWAYRDGTWEAVLGSALETSNAIRMSGPEPGATGIAMGDDTVVIIGYDAPPGSSAIRAGIWRSGTDLVFERAAFDEGDIDLTAIAWSSAGFVVAGVVNEQQPRAAFWMSVDGRTWTRAPDTAGTELGGYLDTMEWPSHGGPSHLAVGPDRVVALGTTCDAAGMHCHPVSWVTTDGRSWQRGTELQEEWQVVAVAPAHGAYVALAGSAGEKSGLCLMISPDGLSFNPLLHGCSSSESEEYGVGTAALLLVDTGVVSLGATAIPDPNRLGWTDAWLTGSHDTQAWLPDGLVATLPTTGPGYRVQLVPLMDSVLLVAVGTADHEQPVVLVEIPYPSG